MIIKLELEAYWNWKYKKKDVQLFAVDMNIMSELRSAYTAVIDSPSTHS